MKMGDFFFYCEKKEWQKALGSGQEENEWERFRANGNRFRSGRNHGPIQGVPFRAEIQKSGFPELPRSRV
jgi:hypothetical protein